MKTYKVKTLYENYEVTIKTNHYCADDSLYVGLVDVEDGSPVATLTVCLGDAPKGDDGVEYAYIDTNNCPWGEKFVEDNDLGEFTGMIGHSGFCSYPLYAFDIDALKK